MTKKTETPHTRTQKILIGLSVVLLYACLGLASLKFASINSFSSPIWPLSGLAIGVMIIYGQWLWPAIFLGSLATNWLVGGSTTTIVGIATGNTLEALVGTYLVFLVLEKNRFKNYSEFFTVVLAAIIASAVSATLGVSTLLLTEILRPTDYGYTWYTWWSGNAVGIIYFLPIFLEIHLDQKKTQIFVFKKAVQTLALISFFFMLSYLVFVKNYNPALAWIVCPFLALMGIYLDKMVSRIVLIAVGTFIVTLTQMGYSPFEFGNLNFNLIYLQSLLASYGLATLFVRPISGEYKIEKSFILSNIFGWTTIFVVIFILSSFEKQNLKNDFKDLVRLSVEDVKKVTNEYDVLLESGSALLELNPKLKINEWSRFQDSIHLNSHFGEIRGFGFVREIKKDHTKELTEEINQRGLKDFQLKVFDEDYSNQFDNRYLVFFLEPQSQNQRFPGLDLGSEKVRRTAADMARLKNQTTGTEVIQLFEDNQKRPAIDLFHPVWGQNNLFLGWTFATILTDKFYGKAFSLYDKTLNLKVTLNNKVIFQNFPEKETRINQLYVQKLVINIFGIEHELMVYPKSDFFHRHSRSSAPLALLMTLLILFVSGFFLEQLSFNQRTEQLILKRTRELEASKIQLINSSKMASLGEMASGMAHEINNPITIILGKLKIIRMMMQDLNINNSPINDEIERIELATGRISKIVKGLRSFSRAAQNDKFELIPLENILQETLDLCAEKMKANGIKLNIDPIPEVCLYCRPGQMSQVILNLLNNSSDALNFVQEKRIDIKFKIQEPDRIFISITDNGKGIAEDIAPKIMEPFFTTKVVGKGTGLGLSIAKGIVEDHGGIIYLDELSKNTRFVIELPLKDVGGA